MMKLSAFADEISSDLNEQVEVLLSENIHFIDFRAAWKTNVLDLTDAQITQVKDTLQRHKIGVAAIGSPLGKVPIDSSFDEHLQRLERAIMVACVLDAPYIRIFSFYPPLSALASGQIEPTSYRQEVISRLREMTSRAHAAGVALIHENEKGIYGDTIARNVDLLENMNDTHFLSVLDPANYLQCAQTPYPDAYELTHPWLAYVHVKDVRSDGSMAVAGDGESQWHAILQRLHQDNYDGFISLEPHLSASGQYQGFSGPQLFRQASQALQKLLREIHWEHA